MQLEETVRVAFSAVAANKLRSLLTTLGVIIGIAAVITMVALGQGAQNSVQERLKNMGTNVLTVRPGQAFSRGVDRGSARLTVKDAEALQRDPRHIQEVSPEMASQFQVAFGGGNASTQVTGAWPTYFSVNDFQLATGRLFNEAEDGGRRRVAVLGALVGDKLGVGDSRSLLGQTIQIRGIPFQVIGVLREKGSSGFQNPDEGVYIPLSTAQVRVMGTDAVRSIGVQAASAQEMTAAMTEIDQVLRREHRIRPGEEADFNIRDQTALLSTFQETTKTFTFLLAGVAAISLLVGGIGIMNIMLVSVTERTREIGLRKSLGARRRDVLMQFLIEALVLCLAGGVIGLLLGFGGSMTLQHFAGWNMSVSPAAVVLALAFSAAVGVFFGLWPARRAADLAPIEALRYE